MVFVSLCVGPAYYLLIGGMLLWYWHGVGWQHDRRRGVPEMSARDFFLVRKKRAHLEERAQITIFISFHDHLP